jgi:hypothetical protein
MKQDQTIKQRPANTRLAQWGLKWFIKSLFFYCKFVLVDNLVFQNPPLRQAWERCFNALYYDHRPNRFVYWNL